MCMLQNMHQKHWIFIVDYLGPQNMKLLAVQGFRLRRRLHSEIKEGIVVFHVLYLFWFPATARTQHRKTGTGNFTVEQKIKMKSPCPTALPLPPSTATWGGQDLSLQVTLSHARLTETGAEPADGSWLWPPRCPSSHSSRRAARLVWEPEHLARITSLGSRAPKAIGCSQQLQHSSHSHKRERKQEHCNTKQAVVVLPHNSKFLVAADMLIDNILTSAKLLRKKLYFSVCTNSMEK